MTLARELSDRTVETLVERTGAELVREERLKSEAFGGVDVGAIRIWSSPQLSKMVYVGMAVEPIGLDSHMVFAFTPASSAVPHFTLDSVANADTFAFHIDMIPRVDLGANLGYIDEVYTPLTPVQEDAANIEGLTPAHLSTRQLAIMSPWMLAYRANDEAFKAISVPLNAYSDHWFKLLSNGVQVDVDSDALAERDRRNRAAIFSPEVDPVWAQVDRLLGPDVSGRIQNELKTQEIA